MNAGDVLRRVRSWAGDNGGTFISPTDVFDLINDAQMELAIEVKYSVSSSSIVFDSSGPSKPLPVGFLTAISAKIGDNYLKPISRNHIISSNAQETGEPHYYYIEGDSLIVYPTPSMEFTVQLKYISQPDVVAAEVDSLSFSPVFHPLIVRMVFALLKEKDEDFEAAQAIKNEVFSKAASLVALTQSAQEETYPVVRETDSQIYGVGVYYDV